MALRIDQDVALIVGDFLQLNVTLDSSFTNDLQVDHDIFYVIKSLKNSQVAVIAKEIVASVGKIAITGKRTFTIQIEKTDTEGVALFDDITESTLFFHSCKIVNTNPSTNRPFTVFTGQVIISPQEVEENPPA